MHSATTNMIAVFDSRSTTFAPSPLSPAAFSSATTAAQSAAQSIGFPISRRPSFPPSRALRPFASISHLSPVKSSTPTPGGRSAMAKGRRTLKLIEAPKNCKMSFQLNMSQAEFSRQKWAKRSHVHARVIMYSLNYVYFAPVYLLSMSFFFLCITFVLCCKLDPFSVASFEPCKNKTNTYRAFSSSK